MSDVHTPGTTSVTADLQIEIDGEPVRVTGDGQRLRVAITDPVRVWSELRLVGPVRYRAAGSAVAQQLDGLGLTVEVVADRATLLTIGHGASSRAGRIFFGTALIRLGRPTVVLAAALTAARGAVRHRRARRRRD